MKKFIITTDLDGTFLGHNDFDFKVNISLVREIIKKGVPIIFNTSKTFEEVVEIKNEIGFYCPIITENGCGIYYPKYKTNSKKLNRSHFKLISKNFSREYLNKIIKRHFQEFKQDFDLSTNIGTPDLVKISGLPSQKVKKIINRNFSELIVWKSNNARLSLFKARIEEYGLSLTRGARFLHLKGKTNKGVALSNLLKYMKKETDMTNLRLIGLGDSENDLEMLERCDHSFLIKIPNRKFIKTGSSKFLKSNKPAPTGWAECLFRVQSFKDSILKDYKNG